MTPFYHKLKKGMCQTQRTNVVEVLEIAEIIELVEVVPSWHQRSEGFLSVVRLPRGIRSPFHWGGPLSLENKEWSPSEIVATGEFHGVIMGQWGYPLLVIRYSENLSQPAVLQIYTISTTSTTFTIFTILVAMVLTI